MQCLLKLWECREVQNGQYLQVFRVCQRCLWSLGIFECLDLTYVCIRIPIIVDMYWYVIALSVVSHKRVMLCRRLTVSSYAEVLFHLVPKTFENHQRILHGLSVPSIMNNISMYNCSIPFCGYAEGGFKFIIPQSMCTHTRLKQKEAYV